MPKRKSTYRVLVILEVDEVYENHDQIRELTHAVLGEFPTEAEGVASLIKAVDSLSLETNRQARVIAS